MKRFEDCQERARAGAGERSELLLARECYVRRAWADAHGAFSRAARDTPLEAEDLERLATTAYLVGRDEEYLESLERAFQAHLDIGRPDRAIRCAFWIGFRLLMRDETGRATGWFARARRLLERDPCESADQGYLLLPIVEQRIDTGDLEGAYAAAADAAAIGERCGDADLIACARHQQGRIRLQEGQEERGLALLDETMVSVTSGELSPIVTGLMFCSVIQACQEVYALDRAREWTAALATWCEEQPEMIAFAGTCQVHRAEILQLEGAWPDAMNVARSACARSRGVNQRAEAAALYQQAEIHRLKGDYTAAEEAYRAASRLGLEPQPGLALLRLAQQSFDAAATGLRRAVSTTTPRLERMSLLPAHVEVLLAVGAVEEARNSCSELEEIAASFDTGVPGAIAAQARGAVCLAEGDPHAALASLRRAFAVWQRIEAPYAAARVRELIGFACRALGDEDGAELELVAARSVLDRLGASPDVARIDSLLGDPPRAQQRGLTPRQLQVLRLVATGETNKAIAARLCLSEKTIERHVSNLFAKLDVSSRAAATAYAYQHGLL